MLNKEFMKTIAVSAITLLAFSQPSHAFNSDLTVYIWGADISGTATLGSQTIPQQPVEIDFDDILDKLDFGIQLHYEGVGENWGGGLDYTYLKLSDTNDEGVKGEVKSTLTELFALYRANQAVDVLAGVRFLGLDMSVTGPNEQANADGERDLTDVFAGGRARLPISDTVLFVMRGDIGTGDSDLVWNALLGIDWHVSNSIALRGGYRWLDYDLDKDDASVEAKLDISMSGPFLGVGFQW
jgi:opacity protein-like surface antigen